MRLILPLILLSACVSNLDKSDFARYPNAYDRAVMSCVGSQYGIAYDDTEYYKVRIFQIPDFYWVSVGLPDDVIGQYHHTPQGNAEIRIRDYDTTGPQIRKESYYMTLAHEANHRAGHYATGDNDADHKQAEHWDFAYQCAVQAIEMGWPMP